MNLQLEASSRLTSGIRRELQHTIIERLIMDRNFRKLFFKKPELAIKRVGLNVSKSELERLNNVDWTLHTSDESDFKEHEVMRCYSIN